MKGLEAIRKQILDDAMAESERQLQTAKEKADARLASGLAAENKALESLLKKNSDEAAMKKDRMLTTANLEARKKLLTTKQEMISRAFERAEDIFKQMDKEKYIKFIETLIRDYAETGDEKLVIAPADTEILDAAFLSKANEALKTAGKKGEISFAEEKGDFSKGVVLLGRNSEINCTLKSLLNQVKQSLESEVAAVLFR